MEATLIKEINVASFLDIIISDKHNSNKLIKNLTYSEINSNKFYQNAVRKTQTKTFINGKKLIKMSNHVFGCLIQFKLKEVKKWK